MYSFIFIIISIVASFGPEACHCEAARLIRVPLTRTTTQQVGQYDQPVVSYHTSLQIGTPPVEFKVQFDLGAQEHFVPHYSWNPFNRNLHYSSGFQCKSSSTCKKDDRSLIVDYQNCQLTGKRYEDIISLNALGQLNSNTSSSALKSINWIQNFLAISKASDGRFSSLPIDGYFGLAPAAQSPSSLRSLLLNLHDNRFIDNLQFSLWLNPMLDSSQGGELILGGIDPGRIQGQIYWHHLATANYNNWQLNLQFVTLGSQRVSCANVSPSCQVKFSSGLSDSYGPREDVKQIYSLLNTSQQASGLQLIDCRRIPQLPVLTFYIDGVPYALLPSNYIRKTTDGRIFKKDTCYVAIFPSADAREWTLGLNFLGAYYSIYDMTYRQIGFAAMR